MCSVMNNRSSKIRLPSKAPTNHKSTSSKSSNTTAALTGDDGNNNVDTYFVQIELETYLKNSRLIF